MISDVDLTRAAQTGDHQAADQLIRRHTGLAYGIAGDYWLPGADQDDTRQEALIALYAAAVDYRAAAGVPFEAFARIVIRRRLASAVTHARAGKHRPLTDAQRVTILPDGELGEAITLQRDPRGDLHEQAERRQHVRDVLRAISRDLTPLERTAVLHLTNGGPVTSKAIDNAAHRARRKLRAA